MSLLLLTLRVQVAWWLPLYLRTLAFFCDTFGTQPDEEKLRRVVARGIRVKVVPY